MNKTQFDALMSYSKRFNLGHLPVNLVLGLWLSGYDFHETSKK